jgi:hypothetical protein
LLPSIVTNVLLSGDRDSVGREAGYGKRNLVAVFAKSFDVVGRIVVRARPLGRFGEVEEAVKADGRPPER